MFFKNRFHAYFFRGKLFIPLYILFDIVISTNKPYFFPQNMYHLFRLYSECPDTAHQPNFFMQVLRYTELTLAEMTNLVERRWFGGQICKENKVK